jgi:four helix bundle protein
MDISELYSLTMDFSQKIWDFVATWPNFAKYTMGKQIVRSADSISANLQEGLGRYHFKDRNLFYLYARGSLFETRCWIEKANKRNLIPQVKQTALLEQMNIIHLEINIIIKATRNQLSH